MKQRGTIYIDACKSSVNQAIKLRRVDNVWRAATQAKSAECGEEHVILLENVDPKFPRNEKGEIDWWPS
ncbi:MAG: hypothetical protein V2A77_11890 [Pseudomonadota bacterium]